MPSRKYLEKLLETGEEKGVELDRQQLEKALKFIERKTGGEMRLGAFGFEHTFEVAKILASLMQDTQFVIKGLLHDILSIASIGEVEKEFGAETAKFIKQRSEFKQRLEQASTHSKPIAMRKMFLAMAKDPLFVLIELANKLEHLRKISSLGEEKAKKLANETMLVFAPIAYKMGIFSIASEMEDLAFRCIYPEKFSEIEVLAKKEYEEREKEIDETKKILGEKLAQAGIKARVEGRKKHIYSIYGKMQRKGIGFGQLYDLIGLRVITKTEKDCYEALGAIHSLWKPLAGEFDDYIAKPKPNGYRSIHTTVRGNEGKPFEIQIRTEEMHNNSEFGMAMHWQYKGVEAFGKHDKKLGWIKEVMGWEMKQARETGRPVEIDFGKEIFVLTPTGDVIELPQGATALDFAYSIHSELGNKCSRAKVNGLLVSLDHGLKDGDMVEIITSAHQQPKPHWLNLVKTPKAREKIRQKLRMPVERMKKELGKKPKLKLSAFEKKVRLAKCCSPLPGDEIVGFYTTKRKISVHRKNCGETEKIAEGKKELIELEWGDKSKGEYSAEIKVEALDRAGLLRELLECLSGTGAKVVSTNAKQAKGNLLLSVFEIKAKNLGQMEKIIEAMKKVKGVKGVGRD
ncbi:MAG: HD domain-containing protein [Candidatus Diapherotrites archaeon]